MFCTDYSRLTTTRAFFFFFFNSELASYFYDAAGIEVQPSLSFLDIYAFTWYRRPDLSLLGIYLIFYPFYFQGKAAMVHDKLEIIIVIIFPGDKYK